MTETTPATDEYVRVDTTVRHACRHDSPEPPPPGALRIAYCGVLFRTIGCVLSGPLPAEFCPLCRLEAERRGE